jgi:hypothetical protein
MTKRRLLIDGVIVAVATGVLAMPYLLSERTEHRILPVRCTHFAVRRGSGLAGSDNRRPAQRPWTASVTVSNLGPDRAELISAEIVSRYRTGSESWPVSTAGVVLRTGRVTSLTVQLPATGSDPDGPRVWVFRGTYHTRHGLGHRLLRVVQDRLNVELVYVPAEWAGDFLRTYPENYDSMLTNELGWRYVTLRSPYRGGLTRQRLVPAAEAEQAAAPEPPPAAPVRTSPQEHEP